MYSNTNILFIYDKKYSNFIEKNVKTFAIKVNIPKARKKY